ncbi:MAG: tRNA 4-thiouridine(8) synthase ThiI [Archaeoglobaceae archaeon]|nr:tRNA 4-thiouridine(8) synthase ThiI [Archaeoglobaceae archaeon]MDW8117840.1 tRNA uracil 4-sulfurtransferase ThiI [Archaeoglobaceae archaeon]
MEICIVHYGEIGVKGENRIFFEKRLLENIRRFAKAKRRYGWIEVEYNEGIEEKLRKIPGIRYFGLGYKTDLDMSAIKFAVFKALPTNFETFKISTSRRNKKFPLNSVEINKELGSAVVERTGKKVDLEKPDVTVWVEIAENFALVYSKRFEGIGGLPVGTAGKVVSLISGGIDSPVASFLAMKRGCEVIPVHFFNKTLHSPDVRRKIVMLAEKLAEFQGDLKLYMIPFEEVQMEIIRIVPPKLRMVIYRRSMMRMANLIAEKEGAKALVTGDNISQVASQTLENLNVIYSASKLAVLPPLLGFDKEEIISLAKKIGTYEISILPYEDCCSLMVAKHPETKSKREIVEEFEEFEELEKNAVEKGEIIEIHS